MNIYEVIVSTTLHRENRSLNLREHRNGRTRKAFVKTGRLTELNFFKNENLWHQNVSSLLST